ncbi:hypothetical protein B0J14DRAFT_601776 [Halenospora varia]|nr:hypothetical protein B0J14DRAFT_601776 [Halenospora varia]
MQYSLTTFIVLFALPLSITAYPGAPLAEREALAEIHEYRSIDLDAFPELEARAKGARNCFNDAKIKSNKYPGTCDPKLSKGFTSSHNCPGKAYLCTEKDKSGKKTTTCYTGGKVKSLNAENGECFL